MKLLLSVLLCLSCTSLWANDCRRGDAKPLTENILREIITCRDSSGPGAFFGAGYFIGDQTTRAIQAACQSGCHGNNANSPSCRAQFARAYDTAARGNGGLRSYLLRARCDFDRDRINQIIAEENQSNQQSHSQSSATGGLNSCYYVSNSTVSPRNASCGRTPACVGVVYCPRGVLPGGKELAQVTCEAPGNQCPSVQQCATAEDPSWLTGTQEMNVNNNINYRSGANSQ